MTEIGFGFWRKTPSTRQLHRNYHLQQSLGGAIESDTQYCIHEPYLSHHQDRLDTCVSMEMTDGDGNSHDNELQTKLDSPTRHDTARHEYHAAGRLWKIPTAEKKATR